MIAIISDIHSNYEALMAVSDDIDQFDVEQIVCLGDIVGYGPNPCECVDVVMDCDIVILGNHDQAALFDPEGFNSGAERAIFWTREQLEKATDPNAERRWEFLGERPRIIKDGDLCFVHGSIRNPLSEYVFPDDIHNELKMGRIFELIDQYCFQGHTHVPGIFTEDFKFHRPEDIDYEFELTDQKVAVNVGSVGQPRDLDPRACYVLLDDKKLMYRRVEYDIETTVNKILSIPELDDFLAARLREGK